MQGKATKLAGRSHLSVRPEWLAKTTELPLEPELPIVDAHHHLWDHEGNKYLLPELLQDIGDGHRIIATVFIECGSAYSAASDPLMRPIGETEFVSGLAKESDAGADARCRVAAGIVAQADLMAGDNVAPVLEAQVLAGAGRVKGIRNISAWHVDPTARGSIADPLPGLLLNPTFRRGFAHLHRLGLSFDAWLYHTQLSEVLDLARHFPQTLIVLNHVGGPIGIGPYAGRRQEVLAQWTHSIRQLARCENVRIKIGGFGMRLFGFGFHEEDRPPSSERLATAWRPYVETTVAAFGTRRCMFESNFPVDKAMSSYHLVWNAFKRLAGGLSATEKAELFSGTAAKTYRLNLGAT